MILNPVLPQFLTTVLMLLLVACGQASQPFSAVDSTVGTAAGEARAIPVPTATTPPPSTPKTAAAPLPGRIATPTPWPPPTTKGFVSGQGVSQNNGT